MLEWSTVLLAAISIVLTIFFYYLLEHDKNPRHVEFAKNFPGPRHFPFIGTSWDFRGNGQELYAKLLEYIDKYKSPFRLWFGSHLMIVISQPQELEMIYASSKLLGKPKVFKSFHDMFGDSIFTETSSSIWKKDRKIMQIPLLPNVVNTYIPHMNKEVQIVIDRLSKHLNGEEFVMFKYCSQMSFDIITKSMLNVTFNDNDGTGALFHYAGHRGIELAFRRMIEPWLRLKCCKWIYAKEFSYLKNTLYTFAKKVSGEKIPEIVHEARERGRKIEGRNSEADTSRTMMNIWYEISKYGKDMVKMYGEIITLILGDKVYEEIYEVFGESDREVDEHDLRKMTYLEQVVKEVLRRFTFATFIFRVVEKDCKIGEHVYPEGTGLIILPLGTHFNENYYPNPFEFNPENFSPEAIENRPKYTFIPFGAGPRQCIGASFALLEFKLIICGMLRKYKFICNMKLEDIKLQTSLIMTKVDDYKVSIKRRRD